MLLSICAFLFFIFLDLYLLSMWLKPFVEQYMYKELQVDCIGGLSLSLRQWDAGLYDAIGKHWLQHTTHMMREDS